MTRIIGECEVKQVEQASGRSRPARYTVVSRRNGLPLGVIERYRGAGSPWMAFDAAGQHRGTFYGDSVAKQLPGVTGGGERAAVAALAR
jgi:hypothetical protein